MPTSVLAEVLRRAAHRSHDQARPVKTHTTKRALSKLRLRRFAREPPPRTGDRVGHEAAMPVDRADDDTSGVVERNDLHTARVYGGMLPLLSASGTTTYSACSGTTEQSC
ncbi:hypothetical protein MRX96_006557 [Rhipicephalus microplus]